MNMQNMVKIGIVIAVTIYALVAVSFYVRDRTASIPKIPEQKQPVDISKDKSSFSPVNINNIKSWVFYITNVKSDAVKASPFQMLIIDTQGGNTIFTKDHINSMKDNGSKKILAYLSIGQAERYRKYWKPEWDKKKPVWMSKESRRWKNTYMVSDLMHAEWQAIAKTMIDNAINAGFDGVLFSGIDSYKFLHSEKLKKQTIDFVNLMISYAKTKNSKFAVLIDDVDDLKIDAADGIVKQNLVYDWKSNGITGPKNSDADINKGIANLNYYKNNGKAVFVVEYVANDLWRDAKSVLDKHGFIGYSGLRLLDTLRLKQ